jgi:hypothetical protein
MNHLKNKVNNNLLRLIGQYNMISKENIINNKIRVLVHIGSFIHIMNSVYGTSIKNIMETINNVENNHKDLFDRCVNNKIKIIKKN